MSDDLIITSTTDDDAALQAALAHGTDAAPDAAVLGAEDRETGEPVTADGAEELPAAENPPAAEGEPPAEDEPPAEGDEPADEPKRAAKVEGEDEGDEDAEAEGEAGPRVRKRIDKLTWQREAARRRADKAEAELAEMKRGTKPAAEKPAPKDEDPEPPRVDAKALEAEIAKLGARPKRAEFETDDLWEEASGTYFDKKTTLTAKLEAAKLIDAQQVHEAKLIAKDERAEQAKRFTESMEEARARYDDFDEVIEANNDMQMTGTMQYISFKSNVAHDINYYLATHPDEAKAIVDLGDTEDALQAMYNLEGYLRRQVGKAAPAKAAAENGADAAVVKAAASNGNGAAAVVTKTEEPIRPVGGRGSRTTVPLDQMSQDQYKALRNKQEFDRRRGRR